MATDDDLFPRETSASSKSSNLPTNFAGKNSLAAAYSDKLLISEAVEAVARMLNAFPNARDGVRGGYIGVMAELLTRYPRAVALRCAHPIDGVIRECKFLPTIAEAVKWLEREQLPYRNAADREHRIAEQLADRHRFDENDDREPLEYRKHVAERVKNELREAGFRFPEDRTTPANTPGFRRFTDDELRKIYEPRTP